MSAAPMPHRRMVVAFDFDGTWTRDPVFWRAVVALLLASGHACVMVTGRSDADRWGAEVRREIGNLMPIVFAAGGWKDAAARRAGLIVDVWVDNEPSGIARALSVVAEGKDRFTREWETVAGRDPATSGTR